MRLPNEQILSIVRDAYQPCGNFGKCREAKWDPERGHVPRGFLGATGEPKEVEVVMVFSEPGDPHEDESYDADLAPQGLLRSAMRHTYNCFHSHADPFHKNVRWFMSEIYPDLTFDQQLHHTWLTEGRLCSIGKESGSTKDRTCASHYLAQQIEMLPNAVVVAFGVTKGQPDLSGIGIDFIPALHPSARRGVRLGWVDVIKKIKARRKTRR